MSTAPAGSLCMNTGWRPYSLQATVNRRHRAVARGFFSLIPRTGHCFIRVLEPFVKDMRSMLVDKVFRAKRDCQVDHSRFYTRQSFWKSLAKQIRSADQLSTDCKIIKTGSKGKHPTSVAQRAWADALANSSGDFNDTNSARTPFIDNFNSAFCNDSADLAAPLLFRMRGLPSCHCGAPLPLPASCFYGTFTLPSGSNIDRRRYGYYMRTCGLRCCSTF